MNNYIIKINYKILFFIINENVEIIKELILAMINLI